MSPCSPGRWDTPPNPPPLPVHAGPDSSQARQAPPPSALGLPRWAPRAVPTHQESAVGTAPPPGIVQTRPALQTWAGIPAPLGPGCGTPLSLSVFLCKVGTRGGAAGRDGVCAGGPGQPQELGNHSPGHDPCTHSWNTRETRTPTCTQSQPGCTVLLRMPILSQHVLLTLLFFLCKKNI